MISPKRKAPASVLVSFTGGWRSLLPFIVLLLSLIGLNAAEFRDIFAEREIVVDVEGELEGDNLSATVEVDEPEHGGKPGGHSIWVSWVAPADGIVTFRTDGSSFDTLLSAYYLDPPESAELDRLKEVARNDDAPGSGSASMIQFGALEGWRYEVAVDGYRGEVGDVRLRWDFVNATSPPPIIVSVPRDRAVGEADSVTLAFDVLASEELDLQWRLNGDSIDAKGPVLVLPSVQATNVGRYTLRVRLGDVRFETTPSELQISAEGDLDLLARDKVLDAVEGVSAGGGAGLGLSRMGRLAPAGDGVARGYNGTQIFNTLYATAEPDEPVHCGLPGGASYWLSYEPPEDGLLSLDTQGSDFDTYLAVYTYDPPLLGYSGLVQVACDNDGIAVGGAARVEFPAERNRRYLVVVDGIGGARGTANLNYALQTNAVEAPVVHSIAGPGAVATGDSVEIVAVVEGAEPISFTWYRDEVLLGPGLGTSLLLTNVTLLDAGRYSIRAENAGGMAVSDGFDLWVFDPPKLQFRREHGCMLIDVETRAGGSYSLESYPGGEGQPFWVERDGPMGGDGGWLTFTNGMSGVGASFFRVRIQ